MPKNPISMLQEYCQSQNRPLPVYAEGVKERGLLYICTVNFGHDFAVGIGGSKKQAKQNSAKNALEIIQRKEHRGGPINDLTLVENKKITPENDFVSKLNKVANKKSIPYAVYKDNGLTKEGIYVYSCSFMSHQAIGVATRKKNAKQSAAEQVYRKMMGDIMEEEASSSNTELNIEVEFQGNIFRRLTFDSHDDDDKSEKNNEIPKTVTKEEAVKQEVENLVSEKQLNTDASTIEAICEDIERELRELIDDFEISLFSTDPIVMQMHIKKTKFTVLALGDTELEAKMNVLKDSLGLIRKGCPLINPQKNVNSCVPAF